MSAGRGAEGCDFGAESWAFRRRDGGRLPLESAPQQSRTNSSQPSSFCPSRRPSRTTGLSPRAAGNGGFPPGLCHSLHSRVSSSAVGRAANPYARAVRRGLQNASRILPEPASLAAPELAGGDLLRLDFGLLRRAIQGRPSGWVLAAFESLREASWVSLRAEPGEALAAARRLLAWARAARYSVRREALLADLGAEAWAAVANAHRVCSQYPAAAAAWRRVDALLAHGTQDPILVAEVAERKAAFWLGRLRSDKAEDCTRLAERIYSEVEDPVRLSRAQVIAGRVYAHAGQHERALAKGFAALDLVGPRQEPTIALGSVHLIAGLLAVAGDPHVALSWLQLHGPAVVEARIPMLQLRTAWLKGRLYARLKKWGEAQQQFEQLRSEFLVRRLEYDAALVGVELTLAYAEQRQLSAVWLLGQEMYEVYTSSNIPREASAILVPFAQAARQKKADVARLTELANQIPALLRKGGR